MQAHGATPSITKPAPPAFVSTRNACKLCAPLGAALVFRGIEQCVPLIHGSQGCATYIRRYVISHFREPVDIASSNFSETSAIFGGADNLRVALDNLILQYRPAAIGIATTCLSETIGDDVASYLRQYIANHPEGSLPALIHASTPSYRGTHMDGFHEAVCQTVITLARGGERTRTINLLPGFLSAADLRHLKDICDTFDLPCTLLPDYSETLDGESWDDYRKLSPGGTPMAALQAMGQSSATVWLGTTSAGGSQAASHLESAFGVPAVGLEIPIGIDLCDPFFKTLETLSGSNLPSRFEKQRGRLIDAYIDGHKTLAGARVVIFGEADLVASLTQFVSEIGMTPVLCATGAASRSFRERLLKKLPNASADLCVRDDADFEDMLETCRTLEADILIGNSKGHYLARNLGIPLVRVGFPIHDRIGGQRICHIGYEGTQQLFDRIVNTLMEHRQNASPIGYSYM